MGTLPLLLQFFHCPSTTCEYIKPHVVAAFNRSLKRCHKGKLIIQICAGLLAFFVFCQQSARIITYRLRTAFRTSSSSRWTTDGPSVVICVCCYYFASEERDQCGYVVIGAVVVQFSRHVGWKKLLFWFFSDCCLRQVGDVCHTQYSGFGGQKQAPTYFRKRQNFQMLNRIPKNCFAILRKQISDHMHKYEKHRNNLLLRDFTRDHRSLSSWNEDDCFATLSEPFLTFSVKMPV